MINEDNVVICLQNAQYRQYPDPFLIKKADKPLTTLVNPRLFNRKRQFKCCSLAVYRDAGELQSVYEKVWCSVVRLSLVFVVMCAVLSVTGCYYYYDQEDRSARRSQEFNEAIRQGSRNLPKSNPSPTITKPPLPNSPCNH